MSRTAARIIFGIIIQIIIIVSMPAFAYGEPEVGAKAAILIDGVSGQVLWQKNAHQPLPPASTSKILTAITALDMALGDDICYISDKADAVGESTIGITSGERWSLDALLQGALIRSGNDACFAIAENLAGTEPAYVEWLNLKAKTLGAYETTVKNTNGLPYDGHLMSAYDLALFARYAMNNSRFREIVSTKYATISNGSEKRQLKSTNKLLWQRDDILGIKTGTTDDAGACLVAASNRNGLFLISVVLDSPSRYSESLRILDYGADNFCALTICGKKSLAGYLPVKDGSKKTLLFRAVNDGYFIYPKYARELHLKWEIEPVIEAPVMEGQAVGRVLFLDDKDNILGKIHLQAAYSIEKEVSLWRLILNKWAGWK